MRQATQTRANRIRAIQIRTTRTGFKTALLAATAACAHAGANADAITEWNAKAGNLIIEARLGTPPANRVMALVQTAAYEAANAITKRYPTGPLNLDAASGASADAAVGAAHCATLAKLMPAHVAAIDGVCKTALAAIPDGPAKAAGIAVGEKAAAAVLAARAEDAAATPETYRPHAAAGAYVGTAAPAVPQWPQRKPWLMNSAAQFRPGPPPALASEAWARNYNEVKAFGGKTSTQRTPEQTEIGHFWEFSLPVIYFGVVRSVADLPGRELTQNARLYAAVAQAADDAMIAIFDAKYQYNFWRPVTAIRNGDNDHNDGTQREAAWTPLIETPAHPEYPSAHSVLASAIGTVLQGEVGNGAMPTLATTSPTAKNATRRWTRVEDFVAEVGNARIYEGVHYRFSVETGAAMGRKIGELAVLRYLAAPH